MKTLVILLGTFFLITSCGNDDNTDSEPNTLVGEIVLESCSDGILNQDEQDIDCGGVCSVCAPKEVSFSTGRYSGVWNSSVVNGPNFSDLGVTSIINNGDVAGNFTGSLFITNNFTSCCGSQGNNGDGLITISISNNQVTFLWDDVIPGCEGTFNGTGTLDEEDKIVLNLTGTDCDGDHIGTLVLTKQ